ncbi:BOLA3 [Mytilus edulis]|uniref:BOLA3 n=1 Tax=Mytilus edulis TaxID=6550 RepID=A0A8S3TRT7_MYTED|nr:BOLA3 [Mytilus edulis]
MTIYLYHSHTLSSGVKSTLRHRCTEASTLTEGEQKIVNVLKEKFPKASDIQALDISGGCGSMYKVYVESAEFSGQRTLNQHRMVKEVMNICYKTERQKQINKMYLSGIIFLGCMCVCLAYGILTAKEIGNYDEQEFDEDIFQSPWNRIYIGAFIIAGVCLLHVLVICCIADHEKKNRRKEVGDCVGLSVLLLWVGVIACGTAGGVVILPSTRVYFKPYDQGPSARETSTRGRASSI